MVSLADRNLRSLLKKLQEIHLNSSFVVADDNNLLQRFLNRSYSGCLIPVKDLEVHCPLLEAPSEQRMKRAMRLLETAKKTQSTLKRKKFVQDFLQHFHRFTAKQTNMKRCRSCLAQSVAEREKQKQRVRMLALRTNDVDSYMRLLQKHKNERLTSLLEKTQSYMQSIGAAVKLQTADRRPGANSDEASNVLPDGSQRMTEQPRMLSGGLFTMSG